MKKISFILLLAIIVPNYNTFSQSNNSELADEKDLLLVFNNDAKAFFKLFNDENWKGMTEMMYPKLFKFATRKQLITAMTQIGESGMKMTINEVEIYKVSKQLISNKEEFRKLSYKADMKIMISGEMLESIDLLKESFKESFGEKNVSFDKTTNTFLIKSDKVLIAILEEGNTDWKYLEFNESQPEMLESLFPEKIYEEFRTK